MDNEFQNGVVEEGGISGKAVATVIVVVLLGAGIFFYLYYFGFVSIN